MLCRAPGAVLCRALWAVLCGALGAVLCGALGAVLCGSLGAVLCGSLGAVLCGTLRLCGAVLLCGALGAGLCCAMWGCAVVWGAGDCAVMDFMGVCFGLYYLSNFRYDYATIVVFKKCVLKNSQTALNSLRGTRIQQVPANNVHNANNVDNHK